MPSLQSPGQQYLYPLFRSLQVVSSQWFSPTETPKGTEKDPYGGEAVDGQKKTTEHHENCQKHHWLSLTLS